MMIFSSLLAVAICICAIVFLRSMSRKISAVEKKKLLEVWMLADAIDDPARKVIEGDKILHRALQLLGYKGTMGESLKKATPRLSNANAVWSAHKLRNVIAHEVHAKVTPDDARRAMQAFRGALKDLGV